MKRDRFGGSQHLTPAEPGPLSKLWMPRIGGFLAVLLLAIALVYLQVSNSETALLTAFPAYGLIALATLIAVAVSRAKSNIDLPCLYSTGAFVAYIIIRAWTSPAPYAARSDLYLILAAAVVYGLTITVLGSSTRRITLIVALLAFAMVHVLIAVIQTGSGENFLLNTYLENVDRDQRASGLFANANHLAGLLEVLGILGLSVACWSRWPTWLKVVIVYLSAVCYLGVVLTGSRAGLLSVAVSLIVFVALSLIVLRAAGTSLLLRFGGGGLVLLAVVIAVAGFSLNQSTVLRARMEHFMTDEGRRDLAHAAIEQWRLQPWIGTGGATYRFYGRQFRAERMQVDPQEVHNDYLQLLCEYGIVGSAIFLAFFFSHLRRALRSFTRFGPERSAFGATPLSDRLALNVGAFGAMAAYVVHSALDFNLHIPANALLLAFVFGIAANPGANRKADSPAPAVGWALRFAILLLSTGLIFQAVRLLPAEYYAENARAALRDEEPAAAITWARKALVYDLRNPTIFFYLGRALAASANNSDRGGERVELFDGALKALDRARQLSPLDGSYALDLAFIYDEMGRFREAEWMYYIARARDPRSETVANLYLTHLQAWESGQ